MARLVERGQHKQWLYLFTTLALPAEEILACYGKRWHIETDLRSTDLRSLKQTVRLHHLSVQSAARPDGALHTRSASAVGEEAPSSASHHRRFATGAADCQSAAD
jgi:hypothetical protein